MGEIKYIGEHGEFELRNPQHTSGLYLPVANNIGLKSCVTPDFGGDSKLDQNHFLLAPKSVSNLHNDRDTRNFFLVFDDGIWSATGVSATQEADRFTDREDKSVLSAGRMWQSVSRVNEARNIIAKTTLFSLIDINAEIMQVEIYNNSNEEIWFTPVAAIPIYGRSADNLRDHRHVTSLLNRAVINEYGVIMKPTLSFDERGHQINDTAYYVLGADENGNAPTSFIADTDKFVGEGGTLLRPRALLDGFDSELWQKAGEKVDGRETIGAFKFNRHSLKPGDTISFQMAIGAYTDNKDADRALSVIRSKKLTYEALESVRDYWNNLTPIHVHTADKSFDRFMEWISFQPQLRRIYGCSFLPHHDYGRGGRGWRDLWQDCLALLLTDPSGVGEMLLDNFRGVRLDGTNATIIGEKKGEFKADRNGIPRVWMDHGFWPLLTLKLYIDQTGNLEIFSKDVPYFKDSLCSRAEKRDSKYKDTDGVIQKTADGKDYEGSVLEHILIENITAFYDVGAHGHMRMRGADWNDALDMAEDKGESVAFTNCYAWNLKDIATYLRIYKAKTGESKVMLCSEICPLIFEEDTGILENPEEKQKLLHKYIDEVSHTVSGKKESIDIEELAAALERKSELLMRNIRDNEWVTDGDDSGWFNSYYDNFGRKVEGKFKSGNGESVRMMLTGQVFSIMSGTAKKENVRDIAKSADKYLYEKEIGGYRLNSDFGELRTDLGRMFGFSYGDKENGAVFSHMAVMYGNALYRRDFAEEGYKALDSLYRVSADFERSRIYPGIPEYFNGDGKGLYHYLTGAASWYLLTVVTESFGVRGNAGDLHIEPKLLESQFDENGEARIILPFAGHEFTIVYKNADKKGYGDYVINQVVIDSTCMVEPQKNCVVVPKSWIDGWNEKQHVIEVELK